MKASHTGARLAPSLSSLHKPPAMPTSLVRRWITHPALALGGSLMWGLVELLALARSRVAARLLPR